jgi:ribose transport system ATP-binding protein
MTQAPVRAAVAVRMEAVSKHFGGVRALDEVEFELRPGEVHALAGGNGAGKSTLMKILRGVHQPDAGIIEIDGERPVHIASPHDAIARGIAMIFQEFSLVPTLTVAQNVFLNRERHDAIGFLDDQASIEGARSVFDDMGVSIDPSRRLEDLGTAEWQLTEIAKALSQHAHVLIMDEPTASLAKDEADHLFALMRGLTRQGISIIYVSHRLEEIFEVADRVTVLRDGRRVATRDIQETTPEQVIEDIVGRHMERAFEWQPRKVDRTGSPLLEIRDVCVPPRLNGVSLALYPGEILGFAGLMGSGRSETARALFGIDRIASGEILMRGTAVHIRNPRDATRAGIALVPEDRRQQGLVLEHSVRSNLLLPLLGRFSRGGWMDDSAGTEIARELVVRLGIKTQDIDGPVLQLSGGNQQKVVLAKWMGTEPDVYVMDEPTAGVDIGTKVDIFTMVRGLADSGRGVILISSEFPELLAVCDRVLVFRDGEVVRSLDRPDIPDEETLHLAVQGIERTPAHD